jgi:hypothetical protein
MGDNPFNNTPFAAFGGQLAQAWQTGLETWWKALLSDRGRLVELARHLGDADLRPGGHPPVAGDLTKILEALELMEERIATLERRAEVMADTMDDMVTFLEQQAEETP